MVRVVWSPEALEKLEAIRTYVARFDPAAADRLAARLLQAGNSLDHSPHRGRPGPRSTRELPTVPPYVITYEVKGDRALILTIRHGRQRPLED